MNIQRIRTRKFPYFPVFLETRDLKLVLTRAPLYFGLAGFLIFLARLPLLLWSVGVIHLHASRYYIALSWRLQQSRCELQEHKDGPDVSTSILYQCYHGR